MTRCPHCGQTHGPDNHFCGVTGQPLDLGPRLLGQVLLDRFEVTSLVGEGPLAVVLLASDRSQGNRNVAVKMLHPRYARDAAATERFLAEARKAGELGHPNLVPVLAVGRDPGGAPLVVREFLDGLCAARWVRERGAMPVELAAWVVAGVLSALKAVHEAGLYDGDLTADDVFLLRGPGDGVVVKVLDLGECHLKRAALAAGALGPEAQRAWAPEQVRSGVVNERSDIFAAGAVLYQLVTGKPPYPEGIPPAPQVIPIPPTPSALQPGLNRKLDLLVRRAMSLLPTDRYANAAAFLEALAAFVPPAPPKVDWAGKPATPAAGFVVVAHAAPAPAAPAAAPVAARGGMHKATLIGAPLALPGGPAIAPPAAAPAPMAVPSGFVPGAAAPAVPAPALGPSTARMPVGAAAAALAAGARRPGAADATAPTMPMPVMDAAMPPGTPLAPRAPGPSLDRAAAMPPLQKPEQVAATSPFQIETTAAKGGKAKWIVLVVGLLAAAIVGVVIFATGGDDGAARPPGTVPAAADAAAKPAADAGAAPAPADAGAAEAAAPAPADAAAAEAAAPVEEDAGAAEEAGPDVEEAAPEAEPEEADAAGPDAEPDVVDEGPEEVEEAEAEAEAEAQVADAGAAEVAAARDARVRETAAPDAGPARDAAGREAAARDAATREAAPRDTTARDAGSATTDRARPRDAGAQREGRTGIIRDIGL
ncbi:MAG: serine/threonine protein kinase [Deltaproteobacteria bacterium]|nr:serine/threonine protein kinase [Deltaproteobacteria bacterium]